MTVQEASKTCFGKPYVVDVEEHEEAIKTIKEALEEVEQYRALGTVEELKEAREKQPKTDWIPCEERLPEECIEVLVTIKEKEGGCYTLTTWLQEGEWVIRKSKFNPTVIAWQPLPAPYKKEGAE